MSPSSDASKPSSANSDPYPTGGFFGWFDHTIVPPMRRFGELPPLVAVRDALPWSLIGLAAGILLFFCSSFFGAGQSVSLAGRYSSALLPGFGLMSVCLCAVLPLKLAQRLALPQWPVVAVTLAVFFLSPPGSDFFDLRTYLAAVGASGLFLAMVIALIVAAVCVTLRRSRMNPVAATLTGCAIVLLAGIGAFALHLSLNHAVVALLRPLGFLGDSYIALLLITVIETALWTAGVHGPALLAGVVTPVYLFLQQQNTAAFEHHLPLPHIVVVSVFLFVFPGGAGATLPLAFMLAFSRVARVRKVGRLALVPSLFNINEPLLFGVPLVLNPFFAVPFVVAPAVLATVTYFAMWFGYVGRPITYWPSSIPSVLSTYLATLDWRAVALVALNIAVAAAIYFPFFRAYERHEART